MEVEVVKVGIESISEIRKAADVAFRISDIGFIKYN